MGESIRNELTIREYLLGRVSDETRLEGLEELLFNDEDFCSQVAMVEDGIINDYVFGRLNDADAESFRKTLAGNPDRSFKLQLTQALREKALAAKLQPSLSKSADRRSFLAALKAFFRRPIYVGAFAALLVAVLISLVFFSRRSNPDNLAELRNIYQQARPTQSRISEFGYAPLQQLRGEPDAGDKNRLRRIENSLIEATEKGPGARSHHALGVFYLTQQKFSDAIREFESALKFDDKNAQIHNDLGSAYFELAKTDANEKRLDHLAQSLEEFTRATRLDDNLLEALFNKSLALEQMRLPREARESWRLYLQKDPSSPWAEEARKNLKRIESEQAVSRSAEQVLEDFLTAYRNRDEARAQRIHDETKGQLKPYGVALQLSRRYLTAKQRGDETEAKESLDALNYVGRFEQTRNSEFFFLS
jgi:tetratricopeptide (TPR) repeat protein